jgi:hypothetical protein
LQVRHFRCLAAGCPRRSFAELLPLDSTNASAWTADRVHIFALLGAPPVGGLGRAGKPRLSGCGYQARRDVGPVPCSLTLAQGLDFVDRRRRAVKR